MVHKVQPPVFQVPSQEAQVLDPFLLLFLDSYGDPLSEASPLTDSTFLKKQMTF